MEDSIVSSIDTQRISHLKHELLAIATRPIHDRADKQHSHRAPSSPVVPRGEAESATIVQTGDTITGFPPPTRATPGPTFNDASKAIPPDQILHAPSLDHLPPQSLRDPKSLCAAAPVEMHHSMLYSSTASPLAFDGDTQVMPSQIYRDYTSTTSPSAGEGHLAGFVDLTNPVDAPKTLDEGDTGHIDLLREFVHMSPDDEHPPISDDDKDELAIDTQVQAKLVDESKRFPPKTPAMAGQKRNHRGEVVSSETRTPGSRLSAMFGNHQTASMIGLTQVFNQTQAPSSPLPHGVRSDPIFERPSPNFAHHRHSSPALMMSSPVKQSKTRSQRSLTEPRDTYLPMHESQAMREKQHEQEIGPSSQVSDIHYGEQSEEDDSDSAANRVARRQQRARIDKEARREFEGVARKDKRRIKHHRERRSSASSAIGLVTPAQSRSREKEVWIVSDDFDADHRDYSDADSIEEYDELSQDIIRTSRKSKVPATRHGGAPGLSTLDLGFNKEMPKPHSRHSSQHSQFAASHIGEPQLAPPELELGQSGNTALIDRHGEALGMSQTVAVADSQPTNSETQYTLPPPRPIHPSSVDSRLFVSQSQGPSVSTNTRVRDPVTGAADIATSILFPVAHMDGHAENLEMQDGDVALAVVEQSSPLVRVLPQRGNGEGDSGEEAIKHTVQGLIINQHHPAQDPATLEGANHQLHSSAPDPAFITAPSTAQPPAKGDLEGNVAKSTVFETSPTSAGSGSTPNQVQSTSGRPELGVPLTNISNLVQPQETGTASDGTSRYETAHTHLSTLRDVDESNYIDSPSYASNKRNGRIRTFGEIGADPTPPDVARDVDLDVNIMSGEDLEFQTIVSASSPVAPAGKRRKGRGGKALREEARDMNSPASVAVPPSNKPASVKVNPTLRTSSPLSSAVHSSDKANNALMQPPNLTPPSAKKREGAGAEAFSRARRAVVRGNSKIFKTTSAARRSLETESGVSVTGTAKAVCKAERTLNPRSERATPPATVWGHDTPRIVQQGYPLTNDDTIDPERPQRVNACDGADEREEAGHIRSEMDTALASQAEAISAPDRVFALYKRGNLVFWPATFSGQILGDGGRYRVRFDDDTVDTIEPQHVRSLDLRLGDVVRVNLDNMRKTYIVVGFKNKIVGINHHGISPSEALPDAAGSKNHLTDIRGYRTVSLAVKQRDSLSASSTASDRVIVDAPIASIYITQNMWSRFNDRIFIPPTSIQLDSRHATPVGGLSGHGTPVSRTRRRATIAIANATFRRSFSTSLACDISLFAGMAFAVTYACLNSDTEEKDTVIRLINERGGRILETGFDTLFRIPNPESAIPAKTSPSKGAKSGMAIPVPSYAQPASPLLLTREAEQLGFTALIADKHSRRVKYLQALALGLPCLSGRWIIDSVKKGELLPWDRYLLAAGESSVLGGAVRSRTLALYDPKEAKFKDLMEKREKLLGGRNVLLVMGKGRAQEKRRANLFLTYALGAGKVGKVTDLAEAKKLICQQDVDARRDERWDWVYVDGGEREAQRVLFAKGGVGEVKCGRKRKRGEGSGLERKVSQGMGERSKLTKVVGDEFVVQSLILGALLDDE